MMNVYFADFPVLKTERLLLRQLTLQDSKQIHKLRSDPAVNAHLDRAISTGLEDAAAHIRMIINNRCMYWAICQPQDLSLLGTICYWNFDVENATAEIGYEILPEFQGKGLMTEAIKRVIGYGFEEMKAKTILAFPSSDNERSVAVLKNAGFKLDDQRYANTHDNVGNLATYTLTPP